MGKILKYIPVLGVKYRDWTIISEKIYKIKSNRSTYWHVKCKCGKKSFRAAHHLVNNRVSCCRSCAALKLPFEQSYLNKVKRRAISMNFDFNLDLKYIMSIFTKKCALSGLTIKFDKHWNTKSTQTASLDRIDNKQGYIKKNVQWVHKDINFMKGSLNQKDFLNYCKLITNLKV